MTLGECLGDQERIHELNNKIYKIDDNVTYDLVKKELKDMEARIDSVVDFRSAIDIIMDHNIDIVCEISGYVQRLRYPEVMCAWDDSITPAGNCEECEEREDCLDEILGSLLSYDYQEECGSVQPSYILYDVVNDCGVCLEIEYCDFYEIPDFLMFYDYDNETILYNTFFKQSDIQKKIFVNHAQLSMFPELCSDGPGSCFHYGENFAICIDSNDSANQDFLLNYKEG